MTADNSAYSSTYMSNNSVHAIDFKLDQNSVYTLDEIELHSNSTYTKCKSANVKGSSDPVQMKFTERQL